MKNCKFVSKKRRYCRKSKNTRRRSSRGGARRRRRGGLAPFAVPATLFGLQYLKKKGKLGMRKSRKSRK